MGDVREERNKAKTPGKKISRQMKLQEKNPKCRSDLVWLNIDNKKGAKWAGRELTGERVREVDGGLTMQGTPGHWESFQQECDHVFGNHHTSYWEQQTAGAHGGRRRDNGRLLVWERCQVKQTAGSGAYRQVRFATYFDRTNLSY